MSCDNDHLLVVPYDERHIVRVLRDMRAPSPRIAHELPLRVVVVWHRAMRAGDLGERTKVLYDALQGSLYTDDKQIAQDWRRRCDGHPSVPKGSVRIEVSRYVEPFPETLP